jgi:hypothetical protein
MAEAPSNAVSGMRRLEEKLAAWGLQPDGAWFCGAALRAPDESYGLLVGRIVLQVPGALPAPLPPGIFVNSPQHGIIVGACELSSKDVAVVLADLAEERVPPAFTTAFGREVTLPKGPQPPA